jgi:chromosomal replication initiation ATPase DnaA
MTPRDRRFAVIDEVAASHGLERADILGQSRFAFVCRARDEAIQRVRAEFGDTSTNLGRLFGRNHTAILAALNRDKYRAQKRASYCRKVERVK